MNGGCKSHALQDIQMQSKSLRNFLMLLLALTIPVIVYICGKDVSPPLYVSLSSDEGYILSIRYTDQLTAGSVNIMSLQCWAATVSNQIRVVEPFLYRGSKFGVALTADDDGGDNLVRMSDLLDVESWNKRSSKMGYAPIVTWKHFLEHAPRDLILVLKACPIHCKPEERREIIRIFYKMTLIFAKSNGFNVIRSVNNTEGHLYTDKEFRELVYGGYSPDNTVVLFNAWGGIDTKEPVRAYREGISDAKSCARSTFIDLKWIQSSKLIKQDAQRYREQYLHREYISVMFRTEYFAIRYNLKNLSPEKQIFLLTKCVNSISEQVDKMKKEFGIDSVFLTLDCRKQGASRFKKYNSSINERLVNAATLLYQQLYGNSSSLEDWDDSFDKISSYKTPGYIAQLQKYLAASGTCLLTAGGGSFQKTSTDLYKKIHKNSDSQTESHHLVHMKEC